MQKPSPFRGGKGGVSICQTVIARSPELAEGRRGNLLVEAMTVKKLLQPDGLFPPAPGRDHENGDLQFFGNKLHILSGIVGQFTPGSHPASLSPPAGENLVNRFNFL